MWNKLLNLVGMGDPPEIVAAKQRMAVDHADSRRRVVWGILSMSYETDPAYLAGHASTAVREWYGVRSPQELDDSVRMYLRNEVGTAGYDVFRAAFLARAGQGAGMFSEAQSWELAFQAARMMQQHYQTWQDYGMGYVDGHLQYRAKEGDPPARLAEIRQSKLVRISELTKGPWTVPFGTPMG